MDEVKNQISDLEHNKKTKNNNWVIYDHPEMKTAQISLNRQMGKTTMRHLHNGILFIHKKEENFTLCDNMDLENIMLSEISQSEKDKYHVISLICGI